MGQSCAFLGTVGDDSGVYQEHLGCLLYTQAIGVKGGVKGGVNGLS